MTERIEVLEVLVRVVRTEKERRQGVATDARPAVRHFCERTFGWNAVGTLVQSADADTLTIKGWAR